MKTFSVGDLVCDNFGNMYVVMEAKVNRDGVQYAVKVKNIRTLQDKSSFTSDYYFLV